MTFPEELDSILGDKPSTEWSFDSDLPKLFSGLLGAVMNEELRLVPPVNFIPKSTAPNTPQTLSIDGEDVLIPGGVTINVHAVAVQRHPGFWPFIATSETLEENHHDVEKELDTFKPERWFAGRSGAHTTFRRSGSSSPVIVDKPDAAEALSSSASATADLVDNSADTASSMFTPAKGAYIPFSIGARKCLGRRFAQIEILAALAVILKAYSIELSVDGYATEEEVAKMGKEEKMAVFKQARTEMERKLREETGSIVTLQLRGEGVDLKLKRRGEEVFDWDNDEEGDVIVGGGKRS
jgi:cytochrome P450